MGDTEDTDEVKNIRDRLITSGPYNLRSVILSSVQKKAGPFTGKDPAEK